MEKQPWYKSFSNWMVIVSALALFADKLLGAGIIPSEGTLGVLMLAAINIVKRWQTDSLLVKAAVEEKKLAAGKSDPQ